ITDSWDEIVETLQGAPVSTDTELGRHMTAFETRVRQDTDEFYMRLDDEQSQRQLLAGRLNMDAIITGIGDHITETGDHTIGIGYVTAYYRTAYYSDAVITGIGDHITETGDHTIGIGYCTTGTAGTRWRSCIARAARGGW
ncbi:hypothetical protein Tco_0069298, partial [Tanacetum coccineum]